MRIHRPNLVRCEIVTEPTRTPLVGSYLTPLMTEYLPDIEETVQWFKVRDTIILGDLNVDLDDTRSLWSHYLANLLI